MPALGLPYILARVQVTARKHHECEGCGGCIERGDHAQRTVTAESGAIRVEYRCHYCYRR